MNDPMGGDAPHIQRKKPGPKPGFKKAAKRPPIMPKPMRDALVEDDAYAAAPVRRNAPRPPAREIPREPAREVARAGGVVVAGRDGEQLTRRRTSQGDKYHIDLSEVPAGWTYQWNSVTVLNKAMEDIVQGDLTMHNNGWRAVPAHRFPGRWTPHGYEGQIVVDGLRLEERPASLTAEAKAEDTMRAKSQVRDRTDALRMTQKQLPGSDVARMRGQGGKMQMSIDPGLDIPMPQHELDEG